MAALGESGHLSAREQGQSDTALNCRKVAASLPPELPDNEGLYK
jgi:hypothetical protein